MAPHIGRPYREALLFGLGGVGGGSTTTQYAGASTLAAIGTRHAWQDTVAVLSAALRGIGTTPEVGEWSGHGPAEPGLRRGLADGRPALAWVDEANLPYLGMPKELPPCFLSRADVAETCCHPRPSHPRVLPWSRQHRATGGMAPRHAATLEAPLQG